MYVHTIEVYPLKYYFESHKIFVMQRKCHVAVLPFQAHANYGTWSIDFIINRIICNITIWYKWLEKLDVLCSQNSKFIKHFKIKNIFQTNRPYNIYFRIRKCLRDSAEKRDLFLDLMFFEVPKKKYLHSGWNKVLLIWNKCWIKILLSCRASTILFSLK